MSNIFLTFTAFPNWLYSNASDSSWKPTVNEETDNDNLSDPSEQYSDNDVEEFNYDNEEEFSESEEWIDTDEEEIEPSNN